MREGLVQKRSVLRLFAAGASGALAAGALASPALAAVALTAATGGTSMTAANAGPTATYSTLGSIVVDEDNPAEVSVGRFQVRVPAGFEFRTSAAVTVTTTGPASSAQRPSLSASSSCFGASRSGISVTPTATAITFYVCDTSNQESLITIGATGGTVGVRPTASAPVAGGSLYLDNTAGAVTLSGRTTGPSGISLGTLTQNPGATTNLAVGLAGTATAGVAQSATVTARDAYGNTTPGYRGAVRFTSTDPAAVLPADYTFTAGDAGVHPFGTPMFKTAGNRSLTVTDKASASITGVASTTVTAAAATTLSIAGITTPTASGTSATATVTARDTFGNVATGYRGSVAFTSSDAAATLPAGHAFGAGDGGTKTFPGIVLRTAGNQTVSVSDGSLGSTQGPITVTVGALSALALSPGTSTMDAGASRTFTAQGRDAGGNSLGDLTAGTTFSIAPDGSCAANVCTATTAGPHTVTANRPNAAGTAALQVVPAAPVVSVSLSAGTLTADGTASATVTVGVADSYGNPRKNDAVSLSTDGGAALSTVHNNGDGTYTATVTASRTAGTQTITATAGSASGGTVLTQVAGAPAAMTLVLSPATLTADGAATSDATITVTDRYGNPRAGDSVTLVSDGDVTVSTVTDRGFGVYSATVTASTTAGSSTLTAATGAVSVSAALTELAPLVISGVSPASRGQGANGGAFGQSVTISGAGFTPGAQADFGPGVTVKFTTVVDATQLVAHVTVAADAAPGARTVTVTLADGRAVPCVDCFTVTAGPAVTGMSPDAMGPGGQRTVTVSGSGFTAGTSVTIPGGGVAVTSVAVTGSHTLVVGLSTSSVATPGPRDLIVTNPGDAGQTLCAGCLTITPAPVVSEVSPAVLGGGAQTTVTVTGDNFADGARLSFAGSGVAIVSQQRVDEHTLTAVVSIAGAAVPGARTVSVINGDAGKGSNAVAFAVNGAPTVTGIAPATMARGGSGQVTITGTGFTAGATVGLSTGVTVTDVQVVSDTTITATVSVAAGTGTGNRTVLVTNADFGKGSCAGCFKVS
jgi:hypothetical protein